MPAPLDMLVLSTMSRTSTDSAGPRAGVLATILATEFYADAPDLRRSSVVLADPEALARSPCLPPRKRRAK